MKLLAKDSTPGLADSTLLPPSLEEIGKWVPMVAVTPLGLLRPPLRLRPLVDGRRWMPMASIAPSTSRLRAIYAMFRRDDSWDLHGKLWW